MKKTLEGLIYKQKKSSEKENCWEKDNSSKIGKSRTPGLLGQGKEEAQ